MRVFEHAVEQIRSAIERGELKAGDRLPPEQELSSQLGAGRSSIREAIRVLEAEGLIEVRRGAGTFITRRPLAAEEESTVAAWLSQRKESLIQILQIRERIECLTVSLAASSADRALLAKLSGILEVQSTLVNSGNDIDRFSDLDCEFHLAISAASGNEIADEIMRHIVPAFNESNKAVIFAGKRSEDIIGEHACILQAIRQGDPVEAERCMGIHIRHAQKVIAGLPSGDR